MSSASRTTETSTPLGPIAAKAIPVGLAVGAYGLSYGVLAVAAGLTPLAATVSSLIVLAGGSQFAFVGVLAAGGNPLAGAMGGLLLNLRYLAFGFAIAPHLPHGPVWRRAVDGYLVVDESVALALAGPVHEIGRRFRVVGLTVVTTWIGATALGAYGGQLLGDPATLGLDAAFPAGFLALLAPWLRRRRGRVAAAVGVLLALVLTPITPPGVPILAAGLGALIAMRVPESAADTTTRGPVTGEVGADATTAPSRVAEATTEPITGVDGSSTDDLTDPEVDVDPTRAEVER
jgi:predicted branched-subunit amino acid permease